MESRTVRLEGSADASIKAGESGKYHEHGFNDTFVRDKENPVTMVTNMKQGGKSVEYNDIQDVLRVLNKLNKEDKRDVLGVLINLNKKNILQDVIHVLDDIEEINEQGDEVGCDGRDIVERKVDELIGTLATLQERDAETNGRERRNLMPPDMDNEPQNPYDPPKPIIDRVKVAKYDGTSSSWADYLIQFEMVAQLNKWDDRTKAMFLVTNLRGEAQNVLGDLTQAEKCNFNALVVKLSRRFSATHNKTSLHCFQWENIKQQPGQSLPELAQQIRGLVKLTFPDLTQTQQDQRCIDRFCLAVTNNQAQMALIKGNWKNFDDAVRDAILTQEVQKLQAMTKLKQDKPAEIVNDITKQSRKLYEHVNLMQKQPPKQQKVPSADKLKARCMAKPMFKLNKKSNSPSKQKRDKVRLAKWIARYHGYGNRPLDQDVYLDVTRHLMPIPNE
mgnify:CR=1 FL=1